MSFEVEIGQATRQGPGRVNEDAAGVRLADDTARGLVAAVADGVSSGGRGLEASQSMVRALLADCFSVPETWATSVMLERLVSAHNAWLADHNRRRGARAGTALTTLTALALRGQTWALAHVGDTRAWLLRSTTGRGAPEQGAHELIPLSQDHALDGLAGAGGLARAIGLDDAVRVDHLQGEIQLGDSFLLTSDGVHGRLPPARLAALLSQGSAQQAADALVDAAMAAGGGDDATAVVLRVRGLDARQLDDERADGRRLPAADRLQTGSVIDGYTVTALVAESPVSRVLQARDGQSGALVALKTLAPGRANDPAERAALAHEAWLGQRVAGDGTLGLVRVHARRPDASAFYVVFDWHAGRTMAQLLAQAGRPSVAEVVEAGLALTRALARLHRQGVVHRDIKPANLHRGDDGRWRVLDLGQAVSGRETPAQRELHAGTPSYMNPEQWDGAPADAGSDLFALGVSLSQWLTGRLPYGEVEPYQRAPYRRDPPPLSRLRPDLPMWLDRALARAVARDPAQRFETADEMLLAFERGAARPLAALPPTPLLQRDPAGLWKVGLGVSLLLNLLLLVWLLFLPR